MNPVIEQERAHRSIRSFTPAPVPSKHVLEAVSAAQMAATSSNVQAYSVIQVEDARTRGRLRAVSGDQAQVEECGAFFVISADQRRFQVIAEDHAVPFVPNLETFIIGVMDASLFAQNLVLAFESQGYGTCYIGGLRNGLAEVDELLGLPGGVLPLVGLCVGEIAEDPGGKPRLATHSVLFSEAYPDDDELRAQIAEFDQRMATYYAERGLSGRNWSRGVFRKFTEPQREDLYDYYTSKGAQLVGGDQDERER